MAAIQAMTLATGALVAWMSSNRLRLNPSKTQYIWLGTRQQLAKLDLAAMAVRFPHIAFSLTIRDLGLTLDQQRLPLLLTLTAYAATATTSCVSYVSFLPLPLPPLLPLLLLLTKLAVRQSQPRISCPSNLNMVFIVFHYFAVKRNGLGVNYEVPEHSGKIIRTGTPFRLVYEVVHL